MTTYRPQLLASFWPHSSHPLSELAEIDVLIDAQKSLRQLIDERYDSKLIETFSNNPDWVKDKMARLVDTFKGPRAQLLSSTYLTTTSGDFPVYSGSTEGDGIVGWLPDYDFDLGPTCGLLISTVGSEKVMTTRRVYGRISLSQNCMLVIPKKIEVDFLQFALEASLNQVRGNFMGHMQASFRVSDLRQMWMIYIFTYRISDYLCQMDCQCNTKPDTKPSYLFV